MSLGSLLKEAITPAGVRSAVLRAGLPAVLVYAAILWVLSASGYKIVEILRDPAQQTGQSSFLGFMGSFGVWLWVASAAIGAFRAITGGADLGRGRRELLILMGILSFLLGFDDGYLIHDRYVNQYVCYLTYAACAGVLVLRHFKLILKIDGFAFALAGGLLALSIVTDISQPLLPLQYSHTQIIEEGCKFVGAAFWLYFTGRAAAGR